MAEFLKDTQLVAAIEEMIENADEFLWLICPYIKLHERVKVLLKQLGNSKPDVDVVIVFGKNEDDLHKSISKEDVAFLKEMPFITIAYEKRLHAKFFSSEDFSIITSMNLHQFSSNNNIEAGIKLKSNKWFSDGDAKSENSAYNYFLDVIDNSKIIFEKVPVGKSALFGFKSKYSHSEVEIDETENFFKQPDYIPKQFYKRTAKPKNENIEVKGYCIRTGKVIPFNIAKPMCKEAYDSWAKFKNPDYKEKYCHKTGKESFGKTSMSNPVIS